MNQAEVLKSIVFGFGTIAAGTIAASVLSVVFLRRKTEELRRARLEREHRSELSDAHPCG